MKNIFKLFSFVILFFAMVLESFAIDAPSNLKLDSTNGNAINVSWDVTENAFMYYVYYSKQSGLDIGYEMQTDYVENNSIEITGLDIGSTYYLTVVALDQNGDESLYSNELIVDIMDTTPVATSDVTFALDAISVISYNKIELDFTDSLDNSVDAIREFKIVNKIDNLDTFEVLSTELNIDDNSKLQLTLDRDTVVGNEYEVVVIAIKSADGKNIESGIDNIETFNVVEIVEPVVEEVVVLEEPIIEESIDLNAAAEEVAGPTGANIAAEEIENTTLALAANNDSLPKTGPEHVLMLILSIILGALIFVFKYKKV